MKKTQGSRPLDDPTFDWTARVGPRFPLAASNDIPVYSYEQPAWLFWNGLAGGLHAAGWTDGEVKDWLQGETSCRFLDTFGERVQQLGRDLSAEALKGVVFTVAKADRAAEPAADLPAEPPPFFRLPITKPFIDALQALVEEVNGSPNDGDRDRLKAIMDTVCWLREHKGEAFWLLFLREEEQ